MPLTPRTSPNFPIPISPSLCRDCRVYPWIVTTARAARSRSADTGAAPDSGGAPNRSRGFDFNNFASDLFSSLQVRKTASADTDEGSLGATVDLQTPRPFDYKKDRYAFSAQDAYYEIGGYHRPRLAALMSQ